MKKIQNLGVPLTKEQQKMIIGAACIADGQACSITTDCCNECRATFKCGKKGKA